MTEASTSELLVIAASKPWSCATCGAARYDDLLTGGLPRDQARELVRSDIDQVLTSWQLGP